MSIARQLLQEFRPLFRLLEEPIGRTPAYFGQSHSVFNHPFFQSPGSLRPAIDLTEEGNSYIIEAELPGVKKENVEVRIGDGGQSLTIEGKTLKRQGSPSSEGVVETSSEGADTSEAQPSNQISSERSFTGISVFTRTVWLPRPIDEKNVVAKLNDGILTVTVPKAEDKASVKILVE